MSLAAVPQTATWNACWDETRMVAESGEMERPGLGSRATLVLAAALASDWLAAETVCCPDVEGAV